MVAVESCPRRLVRGNIGSSVAKHTLKSARGNAHTRGAVAPQKPNARLCSAWPPP